MKHVDEVGIRALKQNASAVVAAAAAGETLWITDRGRPVAQLSPIPESGLQRLINAGRARVPSRSLSALQPPAPGEPLSADLADTRDDERF
ncbi:type II toxin-antitoxin system Phd/YefM family antitoxin [Microbacterium sp. bgisy207]|uniref:type II toxin-antitoxin system Phd/YefM family antitoxin n=1 Tax=Microbacterium sp. bgisy207 TaxID=3413800 RepID=UPI003EB9DB4A